MFIFIARMDMLRENEVNGHMNNKQWLVSAKSIEQQKQRRLYIFIPVTLLNVDGN